jgi:putative DNA primase/helicase
LMQRFQVIVYPDVDPSWKDVDRWPNRAAKNNYSESLERLAVLQPISVGAVSDDFNPLPYLRFCPEALVLFQAWRESLEKELRSGNLHPALESHFAKYRKLVPCLALIFHLVDCPEGGPVSADAVLRALAWAEYLAAHAERIYGSVTLTERIGARQIWKHLAAGDKLPEVFAVRHIQQKGWAGLGNAGSIRAALEVLVDHGLVQMREVPASATGGRPAEQYRMNPRARDLI